jgi:hypothetical protein
MLEVNNQTKGESMKTKLEIETEEYEIVKLPFNSCTTLKIYDLTQSDIDSILHQIGESKVREWLDLEAE